MAVTIVDVQNPSFGTSVTSLAAPAFASNPTNGDCIVVFTMSFHDDSNDPIHTAPTDSRSNTYVQIGSSLVIAVGGGYYARASMWYAANVTGGAAFVVTAHMSALAGGLLDQLEMITWALTGVGAAAYNSDVGIKQDTNGISTDLTVTTVGAPTANSIFLAAVNANGAGISAGAGFNTTGVNGFTAGMSARIPNGLVYQSEYKAASIATTFHFTDLDSPAYVAIGASFGSSSSLWYYNPVTKHYIYSGSDPGAPALVQSAAPTPDVDSTAVYSVISDSVTLSDTITPGIGCAVGGTAIVITGSGFGDGATVTVGGVSATSVVVVDHTTITCVTGAHAAGVVDVVVTNDDLTTATLVGGYEYGTPWWIQTLTVVVDGETWEFDSYVNQCTAPDNGLWVLDSLTTPAFIWWFNTALKWYVKQTGNPSGGGTGSGGGWTGGGGGTPTPVDNNGWYMSPIGFSGSVEIIAGGRPTDPRTWANIVAWAASNTAMLGGSPAASCQFDNNMVYPDNNYVVGTSYPAIRVFDGSFDHELCRLPPTTANAVPQAVISMLTANGTIYLSSFDTGTTSADWRGRVFQLDMASGTIVPLGAAFAAGELPYALAWHNGRLWCGTNNGIGTVGKIYWFRPDIDTAWTLDYSLATSSVGGCDSMLSYKGLLYVGTDNAALSRGKVLVRDSVGAYTVSDTGTGGASAVINNGYLAMCEFGDNLYASYWNNSATAVSIIKKFDGASWSTVYNGASTTLRPFICLFVDNANLFGLAGGFGLTGALVRSANGTSWTNLTAQLPETSKTLLPMYGSEVL